MKQLAFIGGTVAATSKFWFKQETKTALILGVIAIVAVGLSDNVFPKQT